MPPVAGVAPKGLRIADLNQDGLSDLVYFIGKWYRKSSGNYQWTGNWHYSLSTGAGFTAATQLTSVAANAQAPSSPLLVDDNGDGYPDFLWHDVPTSRVKVRRWSPATGAFEAATPTRVRTTKDRDEEQFFTVDMNGDGNADLLHVPKSSSGTETLKVYPHKTAGRAHLVTTVTNGLEAVTDITYESLGTTEAYVRVENLHSTPGERRCFTGWRVGSRQICWTVESRLLNANKFYTALNDPWADATDPLTDSLTAVTEGAPVLELTGPLYVVTRVDSSAPVAGSASAKSGVGYVYERGKVQAAGRGLLGFRALTTVDLQTGVRTTTKYRQDFPYIGLPLRTEVKTAAGTLLRAAQNTWRLKGYNSARNVRTENSGAHRGTGSARLGALQPYIAKAVEKVYDLPTVSNNVETAGALLTTVTTDTVVDNYGNPTRITATTQDHANTKRFRQVTANTYGAASATWEKQFGRLTKSVVTHSRDEANDGTYETTGSRSSSFTYYTGDNNAKRGLLRTEVRDAVMDGNTVRVPAHTTTYYYDTFGNRVKATVAAAGTTRCATGNNTADYDSYGRYIVRERDCLNRVVRRLGAYNRHGLPAWSEREVNRNPRRGLRTTHSYTAGGRLYFSRTADGSYTGALRKACGRGCPTGAKYYIETRQPGGGAGKHRTSREYRDALDRVVRTEVEGFADTAWITTDTEYDHLGRVARRSEPYHAGDSRAWTKHTYDLLGRVVRTELPDYQAGNGGVNSVITVGYAGRVATTTNGKGQRQVETRNALDEVIRTADHAGTTVTHAYNAWGQVTGTTTAGTGVSAVTVSMAYDARGRRTGVTDPDRGAWAYAWNGFDELVRQTDAVGNYQVMTYDGLGRLKTRKDYEPGPTDAESDDVKTAHVTWTWDTATNGLGQLKTVEDTVSGYARTHTYDTLGRPDITTHNLGSSDGTYYSKQTYDQYGRAHQVFDATRTSKTGTAWDDNVVQVHYNDNGYAHKWTDGVHMGTTPRRTYREITAQDARGRVTGERLGAGAVRTTRAFDAKTGRITSITGRDVLDRQVQALTYTWDLVGNLTQRTEASVGKSLTETFTYDTLNRLTKAKVGTNAAQTVTYDALGNIKSKTGVGNYSYGAGSAGPHAVTTAGSDTYTYDANGNMLTGAGRTLTYHAFNKVKSVRQGTHTTAFAYGPERSRYKRTDTVRTGQGAGTTTTLYLGNAEKVIAPDGSYTWKRHVSDGVLIEQAYNNSNTRTGETFRYLLYDHLGSVDVIANHLGAVTQDMSFDAWGQRRAPNDWTVLALLRLRDTTHGSITPYGYTGHEMLDATGIIHMNGRIYDPKLGRFMQADPVIQFPHYSQGWNRYSYVLNNPLAYTDPSGYILGIVGGIIGGAIGLFTCGPSCAIKGAAIGAGLGASADVLIQGGNLGQALLSGVSAAAFTYAAGRLFPIGGPFEKVLLYGLQMGVIGGITTTLQGGKFGHGFVAAGTAALVGGALARSNWFQNLRKFGKFVTSTVAGGTVSRITGGKFANGALTSAFASLLYSAAEAAAQRGFQEGLSPAEFEKRFGMTFEESRFRYETDTGAPFPLTKQDALRLFTDEAFAQKQVIPNGKLDTTYRDILNTYAATTVADVSAGGYARQPWYKNLFHNPLRNTKWVGPYGNLEVVFDSYGDAVLDGPYKGTFNFFSPADVSGHWKADVVPYLK